MRTDIAAFIGYAERGPLPPVSPDLAFRPEDVALRITGWNEYQSHFGSFHSSGYLPYAVRAFFENGGRECSVVRVGAIKATDPEDRPERARLPLPGAAEASGAKLAVTAAAGSMSLTLDTTVGFVLDQLLELTSTKFRELALVRDVVGNQLRLWSPLRGTFEPAGTSVRRFAAAATLYAKSAGRWGNRVRIQVTPVADSRVQAGFSLRITCEGNLWSASEEEFYRVLSIRSSDASNESVYASTVLRASHLVSIVVEPSGADLDIAGEPSFTEAVRLIGGQDGLSAITAADFLGASDDLRGLRLLEDIDDVGIVCAPDAVFSSPPPPRPAPVPEDPCAEPVTAAAEPPDATAQPPAFDPATIGLLQQSLLAHCDRMRYRVAVLDLPEGRLPLEAAIWPLERELRNRSGKFGALYYPWLEVPNPYSFDAAPVTVPPSGHVAGIFARTDNLHGVQKPPANEALEFVANLAYDVDDDLQGQLNEHRLNCIRALPGRGVRVWGARSLAAESDADWKFIHVRRLMSMVEQSVEKSTRWTVFEPNDDTLRRTLTHSLTVFLERIWLAGGLKGARSAESFYVKCDETNNPPAIVDQGMLVCEVGIAVAAPMEFLVFEIRRNVASLEVVEELRL